MTDPKAPDGYVPADFSPGFLDHGGPYFLKKRVGRPLLVGLRVMTHHVNYQDSAHGGVISTFADVALSHAVYDAERPRLAPATITLQVNFLKSVQVGDWLEAQVTIDRLGGRNAYTSGQIIRGEDPVATMSGVFAIKR